MEFAPQQPALPSDPIERRRLWRQWIDRDVPAVERTVTVTPRRRASDRRDAPAPRPNDWLGEVLGDRPAGVVEGLTAAVRESLVGTELPAADRERILSRAQRLGLNRFEASLLIAAVQHRSRAAMGVPTLVVESRPPRPIGVARLLAYVIALETVAAACVGAWLLWR